MDKERYNKMRQELLESTSWPAIYMFKFIVPNNDKKVEAVKQLFPEATDFQFKTSKDIRYIGITTKIEMESPEKVLDVYEKAQHIEGIIAL